MRTFLSTKVPTSGKSLEAMASMFQRDKTFTQDFYQLRRQCLVKGKLFEDPNFPAVRESIFFSGGGPKQKLEWKRPHVRGIFSSVRVWVLHYTFLCSGDL